MTTNATPMTEDELNELNPAMTSLDRGRFTTFPYDGGQVWRGVCPDCWWCGEYHVETDIGENMVVTCQDPRCGVKFYIPGNWDAEAPDGDQEGKWDPETKMWIRYEDDDPNDE